MFKVSLISIGKSVSLLSMHVIRFLAPLLRHFVFITYIPRHYELVVPDRS